MKNNEFLSLLIKYGFASEIYAYVNKVLIEPFTTDDIAKIYSLYDTYITSGSACMPIDYAILAYEWKEKCDGIFIQMTSTTDDEYEINKIKEDIKTIYEEGLNIISNLSILVDDDSLIETSGMFKVYNNYLYARKYYQAKDGIKKSIERLFFVPNIEVSNPMDIESLWPKARKAQKEVIEKGINQNLIVTGGPGTGKTTAVFYLLLALLKNNKEQKIYLTAPSGKAASRIKESIQDSISDLEGKDTGFEEEIQILKTIDNYTIHRLLGINLNDNTFKYNESFQFDENSIFVIDEASMIDICIFDSLLKAIPTGARVFILGDRYQLPSVECGAVLADLVDSDKLKDHIVKLWESNRFADSSEVGALAININQGNNVLVDFKPYSEYQLADFEKGKYPVYYYDDEIGDTKKDHYKSMIERFGDKFFKDKQKECTGIDFNLETFSEVDKKLDEARVLCASNTGKLGVFKANQIIRSKVIDTKADYNVSGFYPGMPLMITENNKLLDLYNGDTGILVSFDDNKLYFLIKKTSEYYAKDATKVEDKIMKLGEYLLYPLRMLDLKKVIMAYAITIHKSQGSGYNNIMVVLPKKEGHPLLNRQILYTAITRTKGVTYIVSNQKAMDYAINTVMERHTQIFD